MTGLLFGGVFFGEANAETDVEFPPLPGWRPRFAPDLDEITEKMVSYTSGQYSFVVFKNSTCCLVPADLTKNAAASFGRKVLSRIIGSHPDMNPGQMPDGNVLVGYNLPAFNIVPIALARENWSEIEKSHLQGLTKDEVLVTPLGRNVFDDVGKMALLGRSYMFMDAVEPVFDRYWKAD